MSHLRKYGFQNIAHWGKQPLKTWRIWENPLDKTWRIWENLYKTIEISRKTTLCNN